MKLFIVSDSHGDLYTLGAILSRAEGFDMIVHLGDGAEDLLCMREYTDGKQLVIVRGNCDSPAQKRPETETFTVDDVTVFACHGHRFGVKYDLTRLSLAAAQRSAKLCLFGHTHVAFEETQNGVLFLNPGSARNGKYAIAEIRDGKVYAVNLSL